ncbi:hypothetical protein CAEBREN_31698 [Caenorhabditis brenneri]|uniref:Uncharacterized protein n=1 Tax=Caenorhabditis brenneri TaxID=135651 RepID=G0P443_CAEBE|nr:hypothetical protein CAEBREN_31698 [Caenorhabditis brenneri]
MASQVFQICALIVLTLLPTVIFVTKQDEIFEGMEVIKVWIAGLGSKAEAFGAQFEAPEAEDVEVADGPAGTMDSILQIQCRPQSPKSTPKGLALIGLWRIVCHVFGRCIG